MACLGFYMKQVGNIFALPQRRDFSKILHKICAKFSPQEHDQFRTLTPNPHNGCSLLCWCSYTGVFITHTQIMKCHPFQSSYLVQYFFLQLLPSQHVNSPSALQIDKSYYGRTIKQEINSSLWLPPISWVSSFMWREANYNLGNMFHFPCFWRNFWTTLSQGWLFSSSDYLYSNLH